jgi:phosphatidylserine/phosphatidylglycerophosphate/cardiolipin synthase-like enzyme
MQQRALRCGDKSSYADAAHAVAHNKVMTIDKAVVITGSFNFTKKKKNAENFLVIRSKELTKVYRQLEKTEKHWERYKGR